MDFGKMKVIELRAELQARGLDTKGDCLDLGRRKHKFINFEILGVKAALIDRLTEALDLEKEQAGNYLKKTALIQRIFVIVDICKGMIRSKPQSSLLLTSAQLYDSLKT